MAGELAVWDCNGKCLSLLLYSFSQAAADVVQVVDAIQGWQREVLQNQSAE